METAMQGDLSETQALLRRIEDGDERAMAKLFARYRHRLRRMVKLRTDRRLQGRLDPSDVLQDAYLDVAKRAGEYRANPKMPIFLWLR
jgi:RNA polymerase sigma-70 factor (ECF subfamily)